MVPIDSTGSPATKLVPIDDEPDYADLWAAIPNGMWRQIVTVHIPCGRADCVAFTTPEGATRHQCVSCARDAATKPEGE